MAPGASFHHPRPSTSPGLDYEQTRIKNAGLALGRGGLSRDQKASPQTASSPLLLLTLQRFQHFALFFSLLPTLRLQPEGSSAESGSGRSRTCSRTGTRGTERRRRLLTSTGSSGSLLSWQPLTFRREGRAALTLGPGSTSVAEPSLAFFQRSRVSGDEELQRLQEPDQEPSPGSDSLITDL